jgi:hypothetical protein
MSEVALFFAQKENIEHENERRKEFRYREKSVKFLICK